MKTLFVVLIIFVIVPYSLFAQDKRPDELPVESYNNLEFKDFNLKISSALTNGEDWVFHPLSIVQKYHKNFDGSFLNILMRGYGGETKDRYIVTMVEAGYLDDSVAGQWFQFYLERHDSNTAAWKIKEIRRAFLCARIDSPDMFTKKICP